MLAGEGQCASHKKFGRVRLPLPLYCCSPTRSHSASAYECWQEEELRKVSMAVVRTTYLIDEEGMIVKAFGNVKA